MKTTNIMLSAMVALFLGACGSNNTSSSSSNTQSASVMYPDIATAALANAAVATQILPQEHLDTLPYPINRELSTKNYVTSIASQGGISTSGSLNIPVSALETTYETFFCSLSQEHNVTMSSPECQANIAYIASQSLTGNFNLNNKPILNNPVGVTSVLFQPIAYSTTVPLPSANQAFNVSGGLFMPQGIDKTKIKGIVTYFHGTTFNKTQVGSNWYNPETQLAVSVFASQGYIVIIPDYVGQGADWQNVHPYVLYPNVSAKTAVDMLNAVQPILQNQYGFASSDTLKLFSAGYSEGGAYSVWFNTYLTTNPSSLNSFYNLKHSVGMEGAYNTSQDIKGYLFDDVSKIGGNKYNIQDVLLVNLVKPMLSSDAFLSYVTYSNKSDYYGVFNPDYFNLVCESNILTPIFGPNISCNFNGKHLNIAQSFAEQNLTNATQLLIGAVGKSANGSTYPLDLKYSSSNSIWSLSSITLPLPSQQSKLNSVLLAADVNLTNVPNGNVSIITLAQDSVVNPNSYLTLLSQYPNKFKYSIMVDQTKLQVVSPFSYLVRNKPIYVNPDHMHGPIFEFLYALNIFNQF